MEKAEWEQIALDKLAHSGAEGAEAVAFIKARRIKVGFAKPFSSAGAIWFIDGNMYLNKATYSYNTSPEDPFMLSLIAHEAWHLRQGFFTALSVYGELDAWQLGFRVFQELGSSIRHPALKELMSLPLCYDRVMLSKVRGLMQAYAGKGYRIDLLPLFPLGKELNYRLFKKPPV